MKGLQDMHHDLTKIQKEYVCKYKEYVFYQSFILSYKNSSFITKQMDTDTIRTAVEIPINAFQTES